ncbi:MAG TPA: PhzF family phenazine biosynthesis protein [Thermoleophilaceae bacterium]
MASRRFVQVDVFGDAPLRGNPVAVVFDGDGLDAETMRRLANWTNLSETVFLLPPTVDDADYRVRIFTPTTELPFAGHPTLGACHAWLEAADGDARPERVVQQCGAGLVEVRSTSAGLAFASPPLTRSGPVEESTLEQIVAALGIARDDVVDANWVANGPPWVAVLLGSADQVLDLQPGFVDLDVGVVGFHEPGAPAAIEVRAFFPKDGVLVEDPVTGSLNASLAEWLVGSGRLTPPYVARQGTALGRGGRVHVTRDAQHAIWVAGTTVTCVQGLLTLPPSAPNVR